MVLTTEQMRTIESRSVELGLSWLRLMENAGSAAAHIIKEKYDLDGKKVVVVCGKGNNGGDGYVIARKLFENGIQVRVISVEEASTDSSKEMLSKLLQLNVHPINCASYEELCCQYIESADYVIDSIFGIGFSGGLNGIYKNIVEAINKSNATTIAIDVPSGMNSDGVETDDFVKADLTITFGAYKLCHLMYPSFEFCGEVKVADIGIPDEAYLSVKPSMKVVKKSDVVEILPNRAKGAHKGTCGTAGLLCGSKGYAGASVIAGRAAVKCGAGIVNMIIPDDIYQIVGLSIPEAVCTVLDNVAKGTTSQQVANTIVSTFNKCSAGLIGCGIGKNEQAKHNVLDVMKKCTIPLVIDADGINILSSDIRCIKQYTNDVVITPHPKEAARLLGVSVEEIQSNRLNSAKTLAHKTGAITVLKGANTIIALPNGSAYVVTDGNPGMATAGTGDMLAGMIVAFMAQGVSAVDSALAAVKIHAMAGDIAVKDTSVLSLTPTDMIDALSLVFCRLYSMK